MRKRLAYKVTPPRIEKLREALDDSDYINKAIENLASIITRAICDDNDATKRKITKHLDKSQKQARKKLEDAAKSEG